MSNSIIGGLMVGEAHRAFSGLKSLDKPLRYDALGLNKITMNKLMPSKHNCL